jgi:hypothetical protein
MTTATRRKSLTPEERAERVAALNAELTAAVEALASSESWRQMLDVASRFPSYSFNNQILLWAQSEHRGTTLTRVAAFGAWKKLGYYVRKGERGYKIYVPIRTRLRPNEVAEWLAQGRNPFDYQDRPRLVVRGFGVTSVFDLAQVEAGPDAVTLTGRKWVEQERQRTRRPLGVDRRRHRSQRIRARAPAADRYRSVARLGQLHEPGGLDQQLSPRGRAAADRCT